MELRFTPKSREDLDAIWTYTARTWNPQQADAYVTSIYHACVRVTKGESFPLPADHIRTGYLRFPVGSHVVFFRVVGEAMDVVRVLHHRQDVSGDRFDEE